MFVFHLLAGYRGSGKDSFCFYLQKSSPYNFHIFKSKDFNESNPVYPFNFLDKEIVSLRVGLADEVKTLVHEELGIKIDNLQLLDLAKNYLQFYDITSQKYFPLRHFYIQTGMSMRAIDPNFWCKKAMERINKIFPIDLEASSKDIVNIFITDYRFPNEKAYFENFGKVITYRIFTPYINGFDTLDIESEHSLDQEITDYLVLRKPEDFSDAIEIFPFYKDFKEI
jgi:hypothetical protein